MNEPVILMVNDRSFNLNHQEQELEKLAYDTASASNRRQALEQAAAQGTQANGLDIRMPAMDGVQASEQLKSSKT